MMRVFESYYFSLQLIAVSSRARFLHWPLFGQVFGFSFLRLTRRFFSLVAHDSPSATEGIPSIDRICWAVRIASRYLPRASCLTQPLAASFLLQRRGQPTTLRVGVAKNVRGHFEAHAWLENDGQIIIGGSDTELKRFTSLAPFKSNRDTGAANTS